LEHGKVNKLFIWKYTLRFRKHFAHWLTDSTDSAYYTHLPSSNLVRSRYAEPIKSSWSPQS